MWRTIESGAQVFDHDAALREVTEQRDALLDALIPFVRDLSRWQGGFHEDLRVPGLTVTAGDVRRAMAAVAKAEGR